MACGSRSDRAFNGERPLGNGNCRVRVCQRDVALLCFQMHERRRGPMDTDRKRKPATRYSSFGSCIDASW